MFIYEWKTVSFPVIFLYCFIFFSPLKDAYGIGYTMILIMQKLKSFLLDKYFRP